MDVLNPFYASRILMVDDAPVNLKLLRKMLEKEGYIGLEEILDPRQVVERYQAHRPDLILLDLNMPHLNGYQVMEQLFALKDPLLPPIIILTAQNSREYLIQALEMGARDYITKPFDRTELLIRVRNSLEAYYSFRITYDQKSLLEEKVAERTKELHDTRLEVIRRLGRAAEFRDNETGMHVIRMSQFSALIAQSMGWDQEAADLLLNASPMHDIGKIGIPDHILLKPGRFTDDEMKIMQTHAQIGADLLAGDDSPLFKMAREIALTHHEKWNGTGYPHGLKGEEIPMTGRIVAVADVFDALTSERPYKKAWTLEAAVALIRQEAGAHFDPEVVKHFELCLPQILAARDEHRDQYMTQTES
ncbi:HD-GYP domain-containing protein [Nitrincola tapanii]|uniref:Response regulator n=1 Tax=Nitrincola tapanii TaxID=1708751 RepID=A0A5A9W035_9GAMM|nr:HD domain-containing phosphohydrolase [Nitrincola tapanii]KAA0873579.1 response regulator [Nitrincola tapanii]